eukprot:5313188-Lingulodinium_polyedra.AAC.1
MAPVMRPGPVGLGRFEPPADHGDAQAEGQAEERDGHRHGAPPLPPAGTTTAKRGIGGDSNRAA